MIRALILSLAFAACAPAQSQTAAEMFAPLIGCWRGDFEGQPNIHDERCFQTLGDHVVDTHAVRPTTYNGESTYHIDETSGQVVFAYASNDGGRSNGSVQRDGDRYTFAPHAHHNGDGSELRLRSTWTLETPDRLVMASDIEENGAWRPFMRITYARAPDLQPPQ